DLVTDTGRALAPHSRWRELQIGDHRIGFLLLRSNRRRTIGFLINDEGLRVTAPQWVPLYKVDEAVQSKSRWILTKLQARQDRQQQAARQASCWEDGGQLPYLGRQITLRTGASRLAFEGDNEHACDADLLWLEHNNNEEADQKGNTVQLWLQEQARQFMGARLEHFLDRTGLRIAQWGLTG